MPLCFLLSSLYLCVCVLQVAEFFDRAVKITAAIKKATGPKIKDFRAALKVRRRRRGRRVP